MSNLGKVYILNIDSKRKEIYPVVYMNKELLYCKAHGSNRLKEFNNPETYPANQYHYIYTYQKFKEMYAAGDVDNSCTYVVYVPGSVKTFFEWIKEKSPIEKEIEGCIARLSQYRLQATCCERNIKRYTESLQSLQSLISSEESKLAELQEKLAEMEDSE